jgi:hypothetical protein
MKSVLAILLLLAALPSPAQEPETTCGMTETYEDCFNRLVVLSEPEARKRTATRAATQITREAATRVAQKAVPEGSPDTAGTIRDFLPLFFSSLGLGGVKEENNALTLTFNPDLLQLGPDNPLSLQTLIRNPTAFKALVQALPTGIRAERKSAFEDQLKDFDDVELSLAWSRESERFGRDAMDHRELLSNVFLNMTESAAATVGTSATRDLLGKLADPNLPPDLSKKTPADLDPRVRADLDLFIAAAVQEIHNRQKAIETLARTQGLFKLDDLVNNQPQILVTANYRRRADLVGPDATTAKASFEMGFANVNGLKRHCRRRNQTDPEGACLATYLEKYGRTLETSPRLKVESEYSQTAAYLFTLPEDNFSYGLDRIRSLTARATLGGYLRSDLQGIQTTRMDLEAIYENVTGDEKRNNRLVATLTFTQKLNDDMATTLSAVWANKPQYRGEVDQELGARFGLKYKIDRKSPR